MKAMYVVELDLPDGLPLAYGMGFLSEAIKDSADQRMLGRTTIVHEVALPYPTLIDSSGKARVLS